MTDCSQPQKFIKLFATGEEVFVCNWTFLLPQFTTTPPRVAITKPIFTTYYYIQLFSKQFFHHLTNTKHPPQARFHIHIITTFALYSMFLLQAALHTDTSQHKFCSIFPGAQHIAVGRTLHKHFDNINI